MPIPTNLDGSPKYPPSSVTVKTIIKSVVSYKNIGIYGGVYGQCAYGFNPAIYGDGTYGKENTYD